MREILFRGKTNNKQWIFGDLQTVRGAESICVGGDENGIINSYYVKPSTITQFTGLLDKNGNKIFEGDIVLVKHSYDKYNGIVKWLKSCAGFYVFIIELSHESGKDTFWSCEYIDTVIGNIFDDEELW